MKFTSTDKRFIATIAAIFLLGSMAVWWEHVHGRREGDARVLEFNRVAADRASFRPYFGTNGKSWSSTTVSWGIPERFRARVLLECEELWINVPLEYSTQLESGELKLTYKRNREDEVRIYRIGRQ